MDHFKIAFSTPYTVVVVLYLAAVSVLALGVAYFVEWLLQLIERWWG